MTTWSDLQNEVYTLTKRPDLEGMTDIAIRSAILAAHKSGKYWKDLSIVAVDGLTQDTIQEIDIATRLPRFRQIAYIKDPVTELFYTPAEIGDLIDEWKTPRTDIYYGVGAKLLLRAYTPLTEYEVCYYLRPGATEADLASWIVDEHPSVVTLFAASTLLSTIGEKEIKAQVDQLVAIAIADLQQDNIEIIGR